MVVFDRKVDSIVDHLEVGKVVSSKDVDDILVKRCDEDIVVSEYESIQGIVVEGESISSMNGIVDDGGIDVP